MLLLRTRSILQLTIFGFLVVTTLLVVALVLTSRQFDAFTDLSQRTASESADAMRAARQLVEHAGALERNARQYTVLGDRQLLAVYATRRTEFQSALQQLSRFLDNEPVIERMEEMRAREALAFQRLNMMDESMRSAYQYPPLLETSYQLSRQTTAWVDEQVSSLQDRTTRAKQALNMQTALLVIAALVLAALFVILITRPLKQVDRSIRNLGRGAYESRIEISGPRDLQQLGQRLDWLRNRLEKLEHQRSAFLRHVSHELKTPLASMQESTALLRDGIAGQPTNEQREILDILHTNCQRLLELIESLLRHNESSFAALDSMPEPIDIVAIIEDVLSVHQLDIRRAGIRVQRNLERLTVAGDPDRVRVVVDNLLSNAVKFSPAHGCLRIRLYRESNRAVFEVEDEGPGIAAEDRERIFTAFYRGHNPPREQYQGTGLGLAIAREYAQMDGGEIKVRNAHHGACLQAVFPIHDD